MNLKKLYKLCKEDGRAASLYIATSIEDALSKGNFQLIDEWFFTVDVQQLNKDAAFSFIAFTNIAKHHYLFLNRLPFIEECERRWEYSEGLMEKYK